MAKIPFLHGQRRASGAMAWHWKPSPRLRKLGWSNRFLGDGEGKRAPRDVVEKAMALNDKLEEWERGAAEAERAPPPRPRNLTWLDLEDLYRQSDEFLDNEPSTKDEYNSRIGQLRFWAQDGRLRIRQIDRDMVRDLKAALMPLRPAEDPDDEPDEDEAPDGRSIFKCAAMLRVLRIMMRFAEREGYLGDDPTRGVAIPTTPSRTQKLDWATVAAIAAEADRAWREAGGNELTSEAGRILRIAFWSMQRRADLGQLNRMAWRTFEAVDPRDRAALANARGEVKGFRLQQHKTGKWVDCPLPAWLHPEIEAAFEVSQWLFPNSRDPQQAMSGDVMRRRVKPLLVAAGYPDHQLRDMRRSGMSWLEDMGAMRSDICVISGHQVFGRKTILDTYMPPDTRAAARAIAAAERTRLAIEAREEAQRASANEQAE